MFSQYLKINAMRTMYVLGIGGIDIEELLRECAEASPGDRIILSQMSRVRPGIQSRLGRPVYRVGACRVHALFPCCRSKEQRYPYSKTDHRYEKESPPRPQEHQSQNNDQADYRSAGVSKKNSRNRNDK